MPKSATKPVEDSVPKINDEIAVGSDLDFQRRWWKFEKGVWIFFTLFLIFDILGFFGRGPFANARKSASDQSMDIRYERIERFSSPSVLSIKFGPGAIHEGKVQLWASHDLIQPLGNQRVVPQPQSSVVGQDGILYTFPVTSPPASVEFALEPGKPGIFDLKFRVPGSEEVPLKIFVMP